MPTMRFDQKLSKLCRIKGWDQAALNKAAGDAVSPSTMSAYFLGRSRHSMDVALRLARALNVDLEYLADDEMDEPAVNTNSEEAAILDIVRRLGYELASDRLLQKENVIKTARELTSEESAARRKP